MDKDTGGTNKGRIEAILFVSGEAVSVKDLANGMYTLKLTTENGTSIHKIVKK